MLSVACFLQTWWLFWEESLQTTKCLADEEHDAECCFPLTFLHHLLFALFKSLPTNKPVFYEASDPARQQHVWLWDWSFLTESKLQVTSAGRWTSLRSCSEAVFVHGETRHEAAGRHEKFCVWKIRRMHLMGTEKTDSKLFYKGGHLDSVFWSLNVFVEGRSDHIWIYLICKLHFLKRRIKSPTADTTEKFSSVIQLSRDLTTAPCQLFLKTLSFLQLLQRETHPKKVKFHTRLKVNIYVDILCLQMSLVEHQL